MLGVALVLMLSALDQTVIGNALPSIVADLHGFSLYAWVATGYLLTSIVTIPIFGKLGDDYGRKPFVLAAALIFTSASVVCAAAPTMLWLVIGRVLQGVGGGILIGTAFACVPELFPRTETRLKWQMMLSVAFSVVNATGPTLGGLLTQYYGWRSVFYLNLPLGAVAIYFVWRYLPFFPPVREHGTHAGGKHRKLDWQGAVLIAVALSALQLFVQWLPEYDAMLSTGIALLVALAGIAALLMWERRATNPLLPGALFAHPALRALFGLSALSGAVLFVLLFYLPLLFQGAYGYSAGDAGLLITPLVLFITLGAIVNARIVTRIQHPKRLPMFGFVLVLVGCVGLIAVGRSASFTTLLILLFFAGLGFGFTLLNLTLFTQTSAPSHYLGIATAIVQSTRLVGGMIGTALTSSLVNAIYVLGVHRAFAGAGAAAMAKPFEDPRILFQGAASASRADQMAHIVAAGHDAQALLDASRLALSHAIAMGLFLSVALLLGGLVILVRMPALVLPRSQA